MAYNAGFPMNYAPQYYAPQYGQQPQPQPQMQMAGTQMSQANQGTSSIIWVQGEAGAKSYLVAPNNTVQLWDSEDQVIYLKSADASGMPSMKILDYKIREQNPQSGAQNVMATPAQDFVTKEELQALETRIKKQLEKLNAKARREETEDE